MSDPKRISPLLDGFALGDPLSEHDGVRCCPAIKENSDEKYIVKIISIPATQAQMDALILAGAYRDAEGAMEYYRQLADDVIKEAKFLKDLSRLEGFLPYENWQMEPITRHRLGYEVYLISTYKDTLEKIVRRRPVTHLEAINLALDICSALNVCRQAGAIYVDLKPSNIFITDKKAYRIGDLGFIYLDALKYTTLPSKYRSCYTPPELNDPMESINMTVDTYGLGMILYQLYNEGTLPSFEGEAPIASPVNADYELAEIILKAIHPDHKERWQDPGQMGQALVSYMQRNAVNDVPITPYTPIDVEAQNVQIPQEELPGASAAASDRKTEEPAAQTENQTASDIPAEAAGEASETVLEDSIPPEAEVLQETEVPMEPEIQPESDSLPEEEISSEALDTPALVSTDPDETEEAAQEPPPEEARELPKEEPVLAAVSAGAERLPASHSYDLDISDELSRIFAKVDDLVSHETPIGVILPEVPDAPDPFAFATEDSIEAADLQTPFDPVMETPAQDSFDKLRKKKENKDAVLQRKRKRKRFFAHVLLVGFLAAICYAGFWFYQNRYLQSIHTLQIQGTQDQLTVSIQSNADESLLLVTCEDNNGNAYTSRVTNGQATFQKLVPNTTYTLRVEIDGFHSLVGQTSDVYTTDTTTHILSFTAVTGPEDGSVVLNFAVDGEEPKHWRINYGTDGEDMNYATLEGHTATITGLSLGKVYTFQLDAGDTLSVSGEDTLTFMASRLILAENLTMTTDNGTDLTIHWTTPGDTVVESWKVRCYNDSGYEQTVTVAEPKVRLTGIDPAQSYNVEVTAAGMTQPARASITANPINVTALHTDDSDSDKLNIRWDFTGDTPEGGWLLMYRIDGNTDLNVIKCDGPTASISPKIPGANYQFTIQTIDGTSVFDNVQSYICPEAPGFDANQLTQESITAHLLKTPADPNWNYDKVGSSAFTDQFALGDPISIVLQAGVDFYLPGSMTKILYVIRDAHGNVIPDLVSEEEENWRDIWQPGNYHYGELDLPAIPENTGSYQLNIYLDGALAAQTNFTIQ